jgi:uncharacterized membrane protein
MPESAHSTARVAGHPIHPMLVPFPIAFWVGALFTDIAYANSYNLFWLNASAWLILAGLVMAGFAALAGLFDFFGSRGVREHKTAWAHMIGNVTATVLQIFNMLVHTRDGADAIVPTGLTLSVIVVLILLVTGWLGWELVYRHKVGVSQ